MRILIDINHPADVHQFKHMIWALEKEGAKFLLIARDKEHVYGLLSHYGFKFVKRPAYNGLMKFIGIFNIDRIILKYARKFKPNILIGGPGDLYIAHVAKLIGKPSLIFDDTEFSTIQNWLTFPFSTKIITPNCFWSNLGKKQVRYNGYHELAYLHKNYFKPNKKIVKDYDINPELPYIIIRLVSWQASHDLNKNELTNILSDIYKLEKYGKVYITSERPLTNELKKYTLNIKPYDIHHVLSFATLFIGESSTMASEAAILGVPAIFISNSQRGYTKELEEKYGLVHYFENQEEAFEKAFSLLKDKNSIKKYMKNHAKMLKETIDVTKWMVNYVKNYS